MLDKIVANKQRKVAERKRDNPLSAPSSEHTPRDFTAALRRPGIAAIAEIKRRSPSKGTLRTDVDVAATAKHYADNGAAAISVLTDHDFFGGSEDDLKLARAAAPLPILRKDFTIDEYQILEASHIGADAILLIMRILSDEQVRTFLNLAQKCGLAALVETHDETEVDRALDCGAQIIGVNSRNLDTFEVTLETALRLKQRIPADRIAVAESGIHTRADVKRLEAHGFDAILVGEALMVAPDPGIKLAELLGISE